MDIKTITVQPSEAGQRLDIFLTERTHITRSQIQKFIGNGDALVNGKISDRNYRVREGDIVGLRIPEKETASLLPELIPIQILYKDDHIVVVDKPAGMVVYPAAGHAHGTLMNALAYHCGKLASVGGPLRPGVVHRLDKDTSGVMVVALDDDAYYNLVGQFRERSINRRYIALVHGDIKEDSGEIARPIGRSESDRKKMSIEVRRGKEAVTKWKVIKRFGIATLTEAKLGTGRTHQIRVHFASIGHPVLGDSVYGRKTVLEMKGEKTRVPRQMLHAEMLGITHSVTGKYMEFASPLPEDMENMLFLLSRPALGGPNKPF